MEKNRLQLLPELLASTINPMFTVINNQLTKIDNKMAKLIEQCNEYQIKNDIIQSVPCVGNVVAFSRSWKTEENSNYCLCEKDGCDLKFGGQKWCLLRS